jgi:hypothetical protein
MNIRTIGLPWATVYSCATTKAFCPITQWMDPAEFQKMRATMELQNVCGDIEVALGYQLADVENSPQADHEVKSYSGPSAWKSAAGTHFPERWDLDIEGQAAGRQLIRFGFMVKLESGVGLGFASAAAKIEIYTC